MPHVEYDADDATEIDGPHVAQKKWLDSIETIPFDPSMRVGADLGEGTPPRAVAPVRVPAARADATPRPARRAQGTPRPAPRTPPRAPARHPHDNAITRLAHVDVAGGRVSYTPDPERAEPRPMPLAAPIPTPLPGLYGAPALPPHVPTARALPPHAVMPTQVAQHVPAQHPVLARSFVDGVTPYPVPPWATGQHAVSQPFAPPIAQSAVQSRNTVPHDHLDIYADTDERPGETLRVGALPPAMPLSLRPSLGRYLLPMIGGVALVVFVAGYFLVRGDTSHPEAAPVASAAALPVAAPVKAAPIVSEIVEPQLPDPSWKHREAQPTIVAKSDPKNDELAAPTPVEEPADEIEMAPMKATPAKAKKSSARRAKRVAVVEIAKAAPAKAAPITKPTKKPATVVAKSAKSDRDPILEEIEKPTKGAQAKATGPGKLVISSSVPTLIYIDGRSTNLMTPKTMNLTAGTHKITLLELKSRKAKTVDVDIAAGTISKLDKKF